eukprot:61278-Hanusia_phi.AAC.2
MATTSSTTTAMATPSSTTLPMATTSSTTTAMATTSTTSTGKGSTTTSTTSTIVLETTPMAVLPSVYFKLRKDYLQALEDSRSLDSVPSVISDIQVQSSGAFFVLSRVASDGSLFAEAPTLDVDGTLHLLLNNNAFGNSSWNVSLVDGNTAYFSPIPLRIFVLPVNDPPSFSVHSQSIVMTHLGLNYIPNVVLNISAGPANEQLSQRVSFTILSWKGPENLQMSNLIITEQGTLSFNASSLSTGLVQFSVIARDDGGIQNGGIDTSATMTLNLVFVSIPQSVGHIILSQISQSVLLVRWPYTQTDFLIDETRTFFKISVQLANLTTGTYRSFEMFHNRSICPDTCSVLIEEIRPRSIVTVRVVVTNIAGSSPDQVESLMMASTNLAPTFSIISLANAVEDGGPVTIPRAAYDISAGSNEESFQQMTFILSTSLPSAFIRLPFIDSRNGSLTFQTALNYNGRINCTAYLVDDGGTTYGGVNVSLVHDFVIIILASNDPPTFMMRRSAITLLEDFGSFLDVGFAYNILPGPADETWQSLTFIMELAGGLTNIFSSPPLLNSSGTLSFSAKPNQSGSSNWTIQLQDSGGNAPGQSYSAVELLQIIILPVNDPPSFVLSPPLYVYQQFGGISVQVAREISPGPPDESSQMLTFTMKQLSGSIQYFTSPPTIDQNGIMSFSRIPGAYGQTNWSVSLNDNGGELYGGISTSTKIFTFFLYGIPSQVFGLQYYARGSGVLITWKHSDMTLTGEQLLNSLNLVQTFLISFRECKDSCVLMSSIRLALVECHTNCSVTYQSNVGTTYSVSVVAENAAGQSDAVFQRIYLPDLTPKLEYLSVSSGDVTSTTPCSVTISNFPQLSNDRYLIRINNQAVLGVTESYFVPSSADTASKLTLSFNIPPWISAQFVNITVGLYSKPEDFVYFMFEYYANNIPRIALVFPTIASTLGGDSIRITVSNIFETTSISDWLLRFGNRTSVVMSLSKISSSDVSLLVMSPVLSDLTTESSLAGHAVFKGFDMNFAFQVVPPCQYTVYCSNAGSSFIANDYLLKYDPPLSLACNIKYCLDTSTFTAMDLISFTPSTGNTKGGTALMISIASESLISAYSGGIQVLYNGVAQRINIVQTMTITTINLTSPLFSSPCCCGRNLTCLGTLNIIDLLPRRSLAITMDFIADIEGPPSIVSIYPGCTSSLLSNCDKSPVLISQRSNIVLDLSNFPKIQSSEWDQVNIQFEADRNATVRILSSTMSLTKLNVSFISPASEGSFAGRIWASGYEKSDMFLIHVQNPPTPRVLNFFPNKFTGGEMVQLQAQLADLSEYFSLRNVTAVSSASQIYAPSFSVIAGASVGSATLRISFLSLLPSSAFQLQIHLQRRSNNALVYLSFDFDVSAAAYIGYVNPSFGQALSSTKVYVVLYNAIVQSALFARFDNQAVSVDIQGDANKTSSTIYLTFVTPSISSVGQTSFCITSDRNVCGDLTSQFLVVPPPPSTFRRASSEGGTEMEIEFYGTNNAVNVYAFLPTAMSGIQKSKLVSSRLSTCSAVTYCYSRVKVVAPKSSNALDVLVQLENGDVYQNLTISYFLLPKIVSVKPTESSVRGGDSVQISLSNFPSISTAMDVAVYFGSTRARVSQVQGSNDFICQSPASTTIGIVQLSIVPSTISSLQERADMTVTNQFSYAAPVAEVLNLIPSRGLLQGGVVVRMTMSHYPHLLTETDVFITFSGGQQATVTKIIQSDSYSGESVVELMMPALPVGLQRANLVVHDGYDSSAIFFFESYDSTVQLTCNRLQSSNLNDPMSIAGDCNGGIDGSNLLLLALRNIGQVQSFGDLAIGFGSEYATTGKLINSTIQQTYIIVSVPPNNFYAVSTVIDLTVTNVKTILNHLQGRGSFQYIAAPTLVSAIFDASGSSLTITFSDSTNIFSLPVAQLSTCTSFLETDPSQPLGKSAKCTWVNDHTLNVILSYDATITVNDYILLKANLIKHVSGLGPFSSGNVRTQGPSLLVKPIFQLMGPQQVGPCDDAVIMALGTFSRPLTFSWTCLGCSDVVQSRLSMIASDRVTLSSSELSSSGNSYRVQVQGVNFLGIKSNTFSLSFDRTSLPIPVVSLSGFDKYSKNDDIILEAKTAFSRCSEAMELQFRWEQVNEANVVTAGLIPSTVLARNSPTFFLAKGALVVPGLYSVKLTVTLPTNPPTSTTVSSSFSLLASDLVAIIRNGDSKIGRGSSQLFLDATESKDPDFTGGLTDPTLNFTWTCKVQGMTCRDRVSDVPFSFPRSAQLSMYTEGFSVNVQYVFTLQVTKDSRAATATTTMTFVDEYVPMTTLSSSSTMLVKGENVLNPFQTLSIVEYSCTSCSYYQWQLVDQGSSSVLSEQSNELFLPSSSFVQGRYYTVIVTSFQEPSPGQFCNGMCKGSSFFQFRVNRAPSGGQCAVQPTEGYELDTKFQVECGSFADTDLPLSFQFSYTVKNGTEAPAFTPSSSPMRELYLPSGVVDISVTAIDSLGAQSLYVLNPVVVLPISAIAPTAAQQALDNFVLLGKSSDFSNYAISLTQKLNKDSVTLRAGARRQGILSDNIMIRSNAVLSLSQIISKQVPSAGNVLQTIGTLTFLVNSSEPLTTEAAVAAVEILSNITRLIPLVLEFSLARSDVQQIYFIVSKLKDQTLSSSTLSISELTRCMSGLVTSTSTTTYNGVFDFLDTQNNLVCDLSCARTNNQIIMFKWKSDFLKTLEPTDTAFKSQFMQINISQGISVYVPPSSEQFTSLFIYMYIWRRPLQSSNPAVTFISDAHRFMLGYSSQNGARSTVGLLRYEARIPVSQSDISTSLWNCLVWSEGWSSEVCWPIGFSSNVAVCACNQPGLIAIAVSSVSICGKS